MARHPWRVVDFWAIALARIAGLASAFGEALTEDHNR